MHDLEQLLRERISGGIMRRTLSKCSVWAPRYRVMSKPFPGPFSFEHHPWLKDMHDDDSEMIVGQKAAQMGYSEFAINKVFFWMDVLNEDVLYLLPNSKPDAADFSVGRFEPALDMSEHIANMFSDTKNVGMKKAGSAILYIRGSRSDSQLKSIPTGRIIFDEYDEMPDQTLALAKERASGQVNKQFILISTPTIPDARINKHFLDSDQKHFFFKCPRCGQWEELTFPESLVITAERYNDPGVQNSHLICKNTKKTLPHELKTEWLKENEWVKKFHESFISGYHVNQMYSPGTKPHEFAIAALRAEVNPYDAQEFHKSKLGLPYVEKGARVTDEELEKATGEYGSIMTRTGRLTVMGVDVGTRLHYEITDYTFGNMAVNDVNLMAKGRVLRAGSVANFEELDQLMIQYGVIQCVIDANPERRKATEFAMRFPGRVNLCLYVVGLNNSNPIVHQPDLHMVKVDRTSWLDMSLSRFRNQTISIPADIDAEYKPHMKALVRRLEYTADGNIVGRYVNASTQDHLAHARNYNEIALRLAAAMGGAQDITDEVL